VKPPARLLLLLTAASLLASCSGSFDLRPTGDVSNTIFTFFKRAEDKKPSPFSIYEVYVEKRAGDAWKLIWALRGERHLAAISYGREYPGLQTIRRPERLVHGGRYRVGASTGELYAGAEFTIDSRGHVVVTPPSI
jgi:hypothetical protein